MLLEFMGIRDKADGIPKQRPNAYLRMGFWLARPIVFRIGARCAQKSAQTLRLGFRGINDKGDGIPKRCPNLILDLGESALSR